MLELFNSIMKSTDDFIRNYTDETSLKCALGMVVDSWVAIYGGNSEEIFADVLEVNKMVNTMCGTIKKKDANDYTDLPN